MGKIKIALLFGGKSTEHEISLQSAKSIAAALDKSKYDIQLIGIDKTGKWHLNEESNYLINAENPKLIKLNSSAPEVVFQSDSKSVAIVERHTNKPLQTVDVAFPILHGNYGEDGTIQGLLRFLGIPYVGPDVLGSAIGMDKDVAKRLLRDAGIPVAKGITLYKGESPLTFEQAVQELGLPLFVKPANAGSSVGVNKVTNAATFSQAMADAFLYDRKILVEEAIVGKEVECAILGNEDPRPSVLGEIIPTADFYSYDAKYIDEQGAVMNIPAQVDEKVGEKIRATAVEVFKVLCCEGMARVDFFLKADNTFVVNEINTLPGFTKISMYPKLWEATGLSYPALLDRLIQLALDRHQRNLQIRTVAG